MVKRRNNAKKNKSQQNADNPKHQKKKDIMELQCPSSIMDMVVKLVYVVIKKKKKKSRERKQGSAFAKQGCITWC